MVSLTPGPQGIQDNLLQGSLHVKGETQHGPMQREDRERVWKPTNEQHSGLCPGEAKILPQSRNLGGPLGFQPAPEAHTQENDIIIIRLHSMLSKEAVLEPCYRGRKDSHRKVIFPTRGHPKCPG